jgi:hypothetical protein
MTIYREGISPIRYISYYLFLFYDFIFFFEGAWLIILGYIPHCHKLGCNSIFGFLRLIRTLVLVIHVKMAAHEKLGMM